VPHLSLASVLQESALRRPGAVAVIEGPPTERRATYAELWETALRRGAALRDAGVAPGDRVALLGLNTIDFVTAYYGILATGAVVVPVAPMLVADEIAFLLQDSGARVALVADDLEAVVARGAADAGVEVLLLGSERALAGAGDATLRREAREPLDPAVLFYTSGTTGRPKGAVLTHFNLVMNAFTNAFTANHISPDEVMFGCLPLFHTFGQTVALNGTFLAGGTLVLQPRFDPQEALALMNQHGVTAFLGVPTMYMALLSAVRAAGADAPLPRLRLCVSGGAPLPVTVLEEFNTTFDVAIQEGYGLSETSPTATVNQLEFGVEAGSIGHPIWGVEVEIADADVDDAIVLKGVGEVGEIVIRGHDVFAGYHERPEATEAAIVDGWFRSGDLGTKDARGFLRIVDRKKDLILRGGYNVYPREVEEVLVRHPDVEQAAVVGVPHATHGEEVLAVVVAREGAGTGEADAEALLAWVGERVARHKRPRLVRYVDELPLGPSRKVLKRELRDRFAASASASAPSSPS
jgi:long-chain acyl-CoA synthetase